MRTVYKVTYHPLAEDQQPNYWVFKTQEEVFEWLNFCGRIGTSDKKQWTVEEIEDATDGR